MLGATALSEAAAALEHACVEQAAANDINALLAGVTAQLGPVIAKLRAMPEAARA